MTLWFNAAGVTGWIDVGCERVGEQVGYTLETASAR